MYLGHFTQSALEVVQGSMPTGMSDSLHDSLLTRSLNRHEVSSTLAGWSSLKWSKQDTLKAAILFMIMKGRAFEPMGINSEQAFSGVCVP